MVDQDEAHYDKTYYLAGPMRGYDQFNFPTFDEAAADLRAHGIGVISPDEHDRSLGFDETLNSLEGFDMAAALRWDILTIMDEETEGVIVLPGWEASSGARAETSVAWAMSKRVLAYPTLMPIRPGKSVSRDEVRIVDPETGGAKGQKLARFDLVPPRPLWYVAEHFGRGSLKYSERNWEKGYRWSLSIGALERHIQKFKMRDTEESDVYHLSAVAFHALALLEFLTTHPDKDDRP